MSVQDDPLVAVEPGKIIHPYRSLMGFGLVQGTGRKVPGIQLELVTGLFTMS